MADAPHISLSLSVGCSGSSGAGVRIEDCLHRAKPYRGDRPSSRGDAAQQARAIEYELPPALHGRDRACALICLR